jgi:H/ACA ribonucleoprotein complex subunit 4
MHRTTPPWEAKRETFVKNRDVTDRRYGCKPEERTAKDIFRYGVINLDKTAGPTSHEVAAWTKKILKLTSIGHGGTLDPNVTGVLPITLEDSTKIVQRPPLRASVKRQLRTRRIYYNYYLEMDGRNVLFRVGCEGGTYIRKLCFDVGEVLGVGAHMQELRRTRAGPFPEDSPAFVSLHKVANWFAEWQEQKDDAILKQFIQPMENALALLPKIVVRDSAVDALCHGANLTAPGILSVDGGMAKGSVTAILTLKGEAVALAQALVSSEEMLKLDHGVVAVLRRVVMPRGTYPRVWRSGGKE